jgi:DNA-binding transcriptional LysR family regulator
VDARGVGPEYKRTRIWRDPFVVAMRRGHPAAARQITLERYLQLPHLVVSSAIIDRRPLDEVLENKGLACPAMVTIPSLAGVIPILEHTDLCAVLPEQWIVLYGGAGKLATAPLPVDGVEYKVDMIWHVRDDREAGHRWLRALIAQEFAALYATASDRGEGPHRLDVRARAHG